MRICLECKTTHSCLHNKRCWAEGPHRPGGVFHLVGEDSSFVPPVGYVEDPDTRRLRPASVDKETRINTTCPLEMLEPSPRLAEFDEGVRVVTQRRGAIYGHPKHDFDRAARLKAVVAECKHPEARHALEMICVKIARLINSPDHVDSWLDIAGYSRTGVMVTDAE